MWALRDFRIPRLVSRGTVSKDFGDRLKDFKERLSSLAHATLRNPCRFTFLGHLHGPPHNYYTFLAAVASLVTSVMLHAFSKVSGIPVKLRHTAQ